MLTRKSFRYRIYPSRAQAARLLAWEDALRFLWNLAMEQRRMGLERGRFYSAFDQIHPDVLGLCEPHPKVWRLEGTALRFPKLGDLRTVLHRPLEGKSKTRSPAPKGRQAARTRRPPTQRRLLQEPRNGDR
jgi:hypothetical protein